MCLAILTARLGYMRLPSKLGSQRTHVPDNVFIVAGPIQQVSTEMEYETGIQQGIQQGVIMRS